MSTDAKKHPSNLNIPDETSCSSQHSIIEIDCPPLKTMNPSFGYYKNKPLYKKAEKCCLSLTRTVKKFLAAGKTTRSDSKTKDASIQTDHSPPKSTISFAKNDKTNLPMSGEWTVVQKNSSLQLRNLQTEHHRSKSTDMPYQTAFDDCGFEVLDKTA